MKDEGSAILQPSALILSSAILPISPSIRGGAVLSPNIDNDSISDFGSRISDRGFRTLPSARASERPIRARARARARARSGSPGGLKCVMLAVFFAGASIQARIVRSLLCSILRLGTNDDAGKCVMSASQARHVRVTGASCPRHDQAFRCYGVGCSGTPTLARLQLGCRRNRRPVLHRALKYPATGRFRRSSWRTRSVAGDGLRAARSVRCASCANTLSLRGLNCKRFLKINSKLVSQARF